MAKKTSTPAPKSKPIPKFKSLPDAFKRAQDGCETSQRAIIGCFNNLGCDHLVTRSKTQPKWLSYYQGIQTYIGSLVGEYGVSETKAEREVLAELNSARIYSDGVILVDPIRVSPSALHDDQGTFN